MRPAVLGLCIFVILSVGGPAALANDASLGRAGESVYLVDNGQVTMVSERITITVDNHRSIVEAIFTFRNEGEKASVLMGFPESLPDAWESEGDFRLHDFEASVDGEALTVRRERGVLPENGTVETHYPYWHTFTVEFEAGQERQVINSYWVRNSTWSNGDVESGYVLTTGSSWKGPIGQVEVRIRLAGHIMPYHLFSANPTTYEFDGPDLVWHWTNLVPSRNISIRFNQSREFIGLDNLLDGDSFTGRFEDGQHRQALDLALALALEAREETLTSAGDREAVTYALGRLLQVTGRHQEALEHWEALRRAHLDDGDPDYSNPPDHPRGAAYHHLGEHFLLQGNRWELARLYSEAKERQVNPQVVRYLEGLMAPHERKDSPPVISQHRIVPEGDTYWLEGSVFDPDGDLDYIDVKVWAMVNGERLEVDVEQLGDPYFQSYQRDFRIPLVRFVEEGNAVIIQPIPATATYQITAVDGRGSVADSGVVGLTGEPAGPEPLEERESRFTTGVLPAALIGLAITLGAWIRRRALLQARG